MERSFDENDKRNTSTATFLFIRLLHTLMFNPRGNILVLYLLLLTVAQQGCHGFVTPCQQSIRTIQSSALLAQPDKKKDTVKLGSEEYYQGFLSSDMSQEPGERVTGDAVLGPTFKFVGYATAIVVVLLGGFMASNGLL